ncbi:MAG: Ig-like domain-containing protein [Bryobacteraceae bacterium]
MRNGLHDAFQRWAATAAVAAAILSMGGPLSAASLRITSPAPGAVVPSGKTLVVEVEASGGAFRTVAVLGSVPVNRVFVLTAPPYRFEIPIPPSAASRTYFLGAVGTTVSGERVESEEIKIDIERPDPPVRIISEASTLDLSYVGESYYLLVDGIYADGSRVTLSYSLLTTYSSDTPAVATVDSMGQVTAVGPGSANITITNAGVSAEVPVTVPPPMRLLPGTEPLCASQTEQFYVQFALPPDAPRDESVTWALNPRVGSIDQKGLYTAPSSIPSSQRVTVTAASVADPTKTASVTVRLLARAACPSR